MLKSLRIENYAIIEELAIDFQKGFSVITGETGAGKSILLGALSLILGQRVDTSVLFDKEKKCVIEGVFDISNYHLSQFFADNELDYDPHTILRREINPLGKSRAFINDTPVNLQVLKELADKLVDIHSQHKTLLLNDSNFQLAVVDAYAGHQPVLSKYKEVYAEYIALLKEIDTTKQAYEQQKKEQDYFQFQLNELEQLHYNEGEYLALEQEVEVLTHSEEIKTNLVKSLAILGDADINAIGLLAEINQLLQPLSKYHSDINEITQRIKSQLIELKELQREIDSFASRVHHNPERLAEASERLDVIISLMQKHRLNDGDDLIALQQSLSEKLFHIDNLEEKINKLEKSINEKQQQLGLLAKDLDTNRKKAIGKIAQEIIKILQQLGMPNIQFEIQLETTDNFTASGCNTVQFLFDANGNNDLKEISKVASGGELSRVMLAIKSLIVRKNLIHTIIFDEIDIGISGDIADKAGNIMKNIASDMQVIAITHLPQIASKAMQHFFVYKASEHGKSYSQLKLLNKDERIEEIAKMLSGASITPEAIENAKVLLGYQ